MPMINKPKTAASSQALRAIAFLVNQVRPDWEVRGVEAVLARCDRSDLARLATAALAAATTRTDQRTPEVIGLDGRHWHTDQPTWQPQPPARLCATCSRPAADHTASTLARLDIPGHDFREPGRPRPAVADPGRVARVREMASRVRAEIRPAPQPQNVPPEAAGADLRAPQATEASVDPQTPGRPTEPHTATTTERTTTT